jgi:hypothetical protein
MHSGVSAGDPRDKCARVGVAIQLVASRHHDVRK